METIRTKKIPRNHVKAEATDKHPAQVDVFTEDVVVGYWNKVDFSGSLPEKDKRAILDRIHLLQNAVKTAREEENKKVAQRLFDYVLNGADLD